jgi:hypothetical protein
VVGGALVGAVRHGHEFKDGSTRNRVIGPSLSPDDRWGLIEYLISIWKRSC